MPAQLVIAVLSVVLSGQLALGATECIGSKSAVKFIVYLHGMDTRTPSKQEIENRKVLRRLSETLNIRFAMPRAKTTCPDSPNQICWTWSAKTSADLDEVKSAIKSAAADCFASKNYSALGFSNGGVALTSLLRLCEKVEFKSAIAVGAAGSWFSTDPKDLRNCKPKLVSMLGTEDQPNQKPVRDLVKYLASINAAIELVEYKGGHSLVYNPLYNQLK